MTKEIKGFEGEIKRFGGDAAKQRASEVAELFEGVVITGEGYKVRGISPCYVVLKADATIPVDAEIVTDFTTVGK